MRSRARVEVGVGVTGIAGPGGGSPDEAGRHCGDCRGHRGSDAVASVPVQRRARAGQVSGVAGGARHGQADGLSAVRLELQVEVRLFVAVESRRLWPLARRRSSRSSVAARSGWRRTPALPGLPPNGCTSPVRSSGTSTRRGRARSRPRCSRRLAGRRLTCLVAGAGAFPQRRAPPRVCGPASVEGAAITECRRTARCSDTAQPSRGSRRSRAVSPHLTLARVREPAGLAVVEPLLDGLDRISGRHDRRSRRLHCLRAVCRRKAPVCHAVAADARCAG